MTIDCRNNGIGFPEYVMPDDASGLGLRVVYNLLMQQLGRSIEMAGGPAIVRLPMSPDVH